MYEVIDFLNNPASNSLVNGVSNVCFRSVMAILVSNHMFLGPENSMKLSMRLPWVYQFHRNPIWPLCYGISHNFYFVCSGKITFMSEQNNSGDVFGFAFEEI